MKYILLYDFRLFQFDQRTKLDKFKIIPAPITIFNSLTINNIKCVIQLRLNYDIYQAIPPPK